MTTTSKKSIDKVLENAFVIVRQATKHRGDFKYNIFERPVTHMGFFQLLHNSGINLSSYKLQSYMCHIKATDYVANWQGDIKLVVSSSLVQIVVQNAEWLNIILDRSKFIEMFTYFQDQSLFQTDFGSLKNDPEYYH